MSETEQIVDALRRGLSDQPRVAAALLFGSRARAKTRTDSDIDVAVLLDPPCDDSERYAVTRSLLAAIARQIAVVRVDLVLLRGAPVALAFQVLKHGRVILDRRPELLHRLRVRTYSRHADYAHVESIFRRATRQRAARALAEDGLG